MSGFLSNEPDIQGIDPTQGVLPGTTGQADPWASGVAGSAGTAVGLGTGQQGISPIAGGGGMGWIANLKEWLTAPFTTAMSPTDIVLLVGIVMIAIIAWNFVLYHLRLAAETI